MPASGRWDLTKRLKHYPKKSIPYSTVNKKIFPHFNTLEYGTQIFTCYHLLKMVFSKKFGSLNLDKIEELLRVKEWHFLKQKPKFI